MPKCPKCAHTQVSGAGTCAKCGAEMSAEAPAAEAPPEESIMAAASQAVEAAGTFPLPQERLIACALDFVLVSFVVALAFMFSIAFSFIPAVGWLIGLFFSLVINIIAAAYILCRDAIDISPFKGKSAGKTFRKIEAVTDSGQKLTIEQSVKRNLPLAIGIIFLIIWTPLGQLSGAIPILGPIIMGIVGILLSSLIGLFQLILLVVETYFVFADPDGKRLGDQWAGTKTQYSP
ncbi:RDD family protein [Candidatus Riflebacteria bacterium]